MHLVDTPYTINQIMDVKDRAYKVLHEFTPFVDSLNAPIHIAHASTFLMNLNDGLDANMVYNLAHRMNMPWYLIASVPWLLKNNGNDCSALLVRLSNDISKFLLSPSTLIPLVLGNEGEFFDEFIEQWIQARNNASIPYLINSSRTDKARMLETVNALLRDGILSHETFFKMLSIPSVMMCFFEYDHEVFSYYRSRFILTRTQEEINTIKAYMPLVDTKDPKRCNKNAKEINDFLVQYT